MSTVVLDIYTSAWPAITNYIKCNVYAQSSPSAVVVSITDTTAGHPARTWSFPGLIRANYRFEFLEVTSGGTIIQSLGSMTAVPPSLSNYTFRVPIQIQCGVTTGVLSDINILTLDGTGGAPDIRTWDISIERIGLGTMKDSIDYTYNKSTGSITLVNSGDLFQLNEWFNISFIPQANSVTDSVPSLNVFKAATFINNNYSVTTDDFGAKLILKPTTSNGYLEIQLPDIATVVENRVLFIEMATGTCAKFITNTGDVINWLGSRTNLFICPNEMISIYKTIDPSGPTSAWRIHDAFGNFINVGQVVTEDQIQANVFNKVALVGNQCDIYQHARLYNDFVLNLPSAQVCNYDDWSTGNNKYKYSLANSSDIGNANKFMVPDRRNMFERNIGGTRNAGDFQTDTVGTHDHVMHGKGSIGGPSGANFLSKLNSLFSGGGGALFGASATPDATLRTGDNASGQETVPKNIAVNKYVLI